VDSIRGRARRAEVAKRTAAETVGTAAHAIRISVEGIGVLTELLTRTSPAAQDPRTRHYVESMAHYGGDILHNLRSLNDSQVGTDPAGVQTKPFAPRQLVEEVASLLRPFAESKGLDFRVEIETDVPLLIMGDAPKIRQVLLGLTHNAIRFTEVGYVELCCRGRAPGYVAFQVQDTGPGISLGARRRISASFARADGTAWHRFHGAQAGLSISHRLVELMGGRMLFHSEPYQGTTVRVELPMRGLTSLPLTKRFSPAGDSTYSLRSLFDRGPTPKAGAD
jgi:signal transduction histidine kinase